MWVGDPGKEEVNGKCTEHRKAKLSANLALVRAHLPCASRSRSFALRSFALICLALVRAHLPCARSRSFALRSFALICLALVRAHLPCVVLCICQVY